MPGFKWKDTDGNFVKNEKWAFGEIMKSRTVSYKKSKNAGSNSQLLEQLTKFQLISQLNKITDSLTKLINGQMKNKKKA